MVLVVQLFCIASLLDTDGQRQSNMGLTNTSLLIVALNLRARSRTRFSSRLARLYPKSKRVVETILAVVLLVLLVPVFLLISLAIRWDSPGAALFRQRRVGKNGQIFTLYKFRTMYRDIDRRAHLAFFSAFVNGQIDMAEGRPDAFKPAQESQITRMGRFLRRTSLDELPQLINIIKGEMGFIGPRPNIVIEVQAYKDWHRERLQVLPGITGLAQINGRSNLTFDQIVRYDIEYVENECLTLDLKILWHTVPVVIFCIGAD
jgi:lipopolysaccharide/colanic/teichoic acid biosynthesis glycosyltransferase